MTTPDAPKPGSSTIDAWVDALQARHRANLTTPEFLKAVRALSARYVERRAELPDRSPIDSAGKRSAFAAFYAPLHFCVVREILQTPAAPRDVRSVVDLGCGTGVAAAACALESAPPSDILGVDSNSWALTEAAWNWRQLDLSGKTDRADLVSATARLLRRRRDWSHTAVTAAWSINELPGAARERLLPDLLRSAELGAAVLVVEPLAGAATPWWAAWEHAFAEAGGRSARWEFEAHLPASLRAISDAAGFRRDRLTARTLSLP